jgi:hypothetical protein
MDSVLTDVSLASIPREQLTLLAEVRCLPGVQVVPKEDRAWIHWDAAEARVLRVLLPVPGVQLYVRKNDNWFQAGRELPAFDVPDELESRSLAGVLLPNPVEILPSPSGELRPVWLRLIPDHQPREATACLCTVVELQHWADTVSSWRLAALAAATCGERVLVLGKQLPLFGSAAARPTASRFWGDRVLIPIGFRPDPLLPEQTLAEAAGLQDVEILLWSERGAEAIAKAICQPLTRAQIKLLQQHHEGRY